MTSLLYDALLARVRRGALSPADAASELVAELTERERLRLLDGDAPVWPGLLAMVRSYNTEPIVAGAIDRVGLPGIRFTDGPRGVVMGASTCFPVPIARAATFDVALEEAIGRAIGAEARAQGANLFGGVCVNLTRHPAWGRAQESYGDEPALLGAMGAALTRGVRRHVMACVKHFALNSMEDARFYVDVEVDDATLHEVYLPHFREVIDAGADAVMNAYNRVNGVWCGEHHGLLNEILREQWGFEGVVISDFVWGLRDATASLAAGLDVEMPFRQQRARAFRGGVDPALVERAAKRVVRAQLAHAAQRGPAPSPDCVASAEHRALARDAAARGCVLLENDGVLPLGDVASIAVIGPLAEADNTGDIGSSKVRPPSTASVLDGVRAAFPRAEVRTGGAEIASASEVAIVVVGYTAREEGEAFIETDADMIGHLTLPIRTALGKRVVSRVVRTVGRWLHPGGGDRRSLHVPAEQERLIERVAAANPNTVVVVITGGAVVMPWRRAPRALLVMGYPARRATAEPSFVRDTCPRPERSEVRRWGIRGWRAVTRSPTSSPGASRRAVACPSRSRSARRISVPSNAPRAACATIGGGDSGGSIATASRRRTRSGTASATRRSRSVTRAGAKAASKSPSRTRASATA